MPSLVVIEQPNDSNISTADKLSRVLRARRDMEAGARHPDALVQREKDEINCARPIEKRSKCSNVFKTAVHSQITDSTLTHTPSFADKVAPACMTKGTRVSGDCTNLYFTRILTRATLISNRANLIPMQFLGPAPNGMNWKAWRASLDGPRNLSGSNFSGSSQASGSRCMAYIGMIISVPAGMWMPLRS
ncbi:hypothetical protein pdam_00008423 [Pocillopora damicornis]|uniref:Uncharacterized protein n=1 Tax=Pocillopora damicornis TaxID=46731 RepID=A0A3M6TVT4_POCDA|nr:hypothetical protein pdam_00008423 [Pocillopora damicornis]